LKFSSVFSIELIIWSKVRIFFIGIEGIPGTRQKFLEDLLNLNKFLSQFSSKIFSCGSKNAPLKLYQK
jgi:hypothetical protein